MNESERVGIDITTTYSGKGTEAARRDLRSLDQEVQEVAGQMKQMASASDATNNSWGRQESALNKLDEELESFLTVSDKSYRAQRQLDTGNDLLFRSLNAGLITQEQHDTLLERLSQKYGAAASGAQQLGRASSSTAREMATLGRALATGNLEQAAQTSGVLAVRVGGIGIAGIAAAGGIAAVVGTLALLMAEQERFDRSLNRINAMIGATGREVALTRSEIQALVKDIEQLPGMNRAGALEVVGASGGQGLNEDLFRRITLLANDFAFATGRTAPKAMEELAKAAQGGGKELLKLDENYKILTLDQYQSIQQFIKQGDAVQAAGVFLAAYEARLSGLRGSAMTPLEASVDRLGNAWTGLTERMGSGGGLETAADRLARITKGLSWLIDNAETLGRLTMPGAALSFIFSGSAKGNDEEAEWERRAAAARKRTANEGAERKRLETQGIDHDKAQAEQDDNVRKFLDQKAKEADAKAKQESERRGREALAGHLTGMKFEQDTQAEIDKAVADMQKRLKAREYYENIYGEDITTGKTTEELAAYHKQLLEGIDAQAEIEENLMRLNAGFDEHGKEVKAVGDEYKDLKFAVEGWGRDSSRALAKAALDGKMSFDTLGSAARRFAEDLLAIQIQRSVMDPLLKGATAYLGDLFRGGGSGAPAPEADLTGSYAEMAAMGLPYHTGGIVGDNRPGRSVAPWVFDNAPRYHRGGLVQDEVPIIARRGEEVLTENDPRHRNNAGPRNVRVEIVNQGAPQEVVSAQPKFDAEGMVIQIVTRDLTNGGPIRSAVQSLVKPIR